MPCRGRDLTCSAGGGGCGNWVASGSAGVSARRAQDGSSDETAGGRFMTTVPSDVRVQAETGSSPQQTRMTKPVLRIAAKILTQRGSAPRAFV
jgi:hypothetical protein